MQPLPPDYGPPGPPCQARSPSGVLTCVLMRKEQGQWSGSQQCDLESCLKTLVAGAWCSLSSGQLGPVAGSFVCTLLLSFPRNFPTQTLIHGSGNSSSLCHMLTQKRQETWPGSLISAHSQLVDGSSRRPGIKAVSNTQAWWAGFLVLPAAEMGKRKPHHSLRRCSPTPAPLPCYPQWEGCHHLRPHVGSLAPLSSVPFIPWLARQQFLKGEQWQL